MFVCLNAKGTRWQPGGTGVFFVKPPPVMNAISLNKLLYTLEEAARHLGYQHPRTISRMIDNQEITAVRIRHRWMVSHEALMDYISNQPTNVR